MWLCTHAFIFSSYLCHGYFVAVGCLDHATAFIERFSGWAKSQNKTRIRPPGCHKRLSIGECDPDTSLRRAAHDFYRHKLEMMYRLCSETECPHRHSSSRYRSA